MSNFDSVLVVSILDPGVLVWQCFHRKLLAVSSSGYGAAGRSS